MAKADYESRTEQLLIPIIEEHHFELVDVEWVKEAGVYYLRAYVDKEGGITIGDCELVSRALSDLLDQYDYISENYILEVSSPGLDRPLRKDKDFARSIGKEVELRLFRPVDKVKEFEGTLTAYDKETVTIQTEDFGEKTFRRKDISMIRLAFYFE